MDLDGEERRAFLREVSVPRLAGLVDVLRQHGRSWEDVAGVAS